MSSSEERRTKCDESHFNRLFKRFTSGGHGVHHSAMPARRVQLADVAARSGVSVSTASYVLSGKDGARRFNEGTRRRVVEAARDLGYVRNRSARSLRQGRTRTR